MEFFGADMPRPIPLDDGRGGPRMHRSSAGSKEKCVYCGRHTYRYVGRKAVCSYCSEKHKAELDKDYAPLLD